MKTLLLSSLFLFVFGFNICDKYEAKVISVYDGDTVTCNIDLGFNITIQEKVRLARIDAPEIRGEERLEGLAARDALRELINGKEITLTNRGRGKYGRVIGDLEKDGVSISDWMVSNGYAEYRDY